MSKKIKTPITYDDIKELSVGDEILLSGEIYCGRDAVLPKVVKLAKDGLLEKNNINLQGSVIFHTAVSPAGVGPTSSNKLEIEESIIPLSEYGVKLHMGKGKIKQNTIDGMTKNGAVFAVIPPVTALLKSKTVKSEAVAFIEEGIEAFWKLEVVDYPIIVVAANGKSIF